jgi:hypothetical protein
MECAFILSWAGTIVHLAATVLSLSGVALAWRSFPNTERVSGPIEQSTGHLHS